MDMDVKMLVGVAIKILIFTLMIAMGLQITPSSLRSLWHRPKMLVGSLMAAFFVVPVVAYLISQTLPLTLTSKAGLWALAITPGAPMTYNMVSRRGITAPQLAASFQITVALLVIVFAPLWLTIVSALTGAQYQMGALTVMKQVFSVQLIPIIIGMAIRHFGKESAHCVGDVTARFGYFALIGLFAVILFVFAGHIMRNIEIWKFIATVTLAVSAIASGHFLAGPDLRSRITIADANVMRNPGLALAIVAWNLPKLKPETIIVIVVYVIVAAVLAAAYTKWMAKRLAV